MSEEGKYSVYQFFPDGAYERIRQFVGARAAVETAKSYSETLAARIGIIRRIIITDADDYCVFEWKHGEGVTYPTPARHVERATQ